MNKFYLVLLKLDLILIFGFSIVEIYQEIEKNTP